MFGHPIHLMLLHFPAALLPTSAGYTLLVMLGWMPDGAPSFYIASLAAGLGWLAAVFGFWDLTQIPKGSKAMQTALRHGSINAIALSLLTASLLLHLRFGAITSLNLILELLAATLLLPGNKLGGDLLLKHHVGLPDDHRP